MGRRRILSHDQILDAAQFAVGKAGAGQLTVDSVAEQAGISKATVLYLYKSKKTLIEAIVERAVRYDSDFNEAAIRSCGPTDGAVVRGRILAAAEPFPEESRAVALHLCAAAAQDRQLRKPMQNFQNSVISRIEKNCAHPRGALLAHLALEGLKLLELLDFRAWPKGERDRILQDIDWLVGVDPKPAKAVRKTARRKPSLAAPSAAKRALPRIKKKSGATRNRNAKKKV